MIKRLIEAGLEVALFLLCAGLVMYVSDLIRKVYKDVRDWINGN